MLHANKQFAEWRAALEKRGITLRWMWETYRNQENARKSKHYPDVGFVCFVGNGFRPHVSTAVVIDYGSGFGLFIDPNEGVVQEGFNRTIDAEAEFIATGKVLA